MYGARIEIKKIEWAKGMGFTYTISCLNSSWWNWGASYLQAVSDTVTESVQVVSETVSESVQVVSEKVEKVWVSSFPIWHNKSASFVNDIYDAYKEDLHDLGTMIAEDTSDLLKQDPTGVTAVLTESLTEGTVKWNKS